MQSARAPLFDRPSRWRRNLLTAVAALALILAAARLAAPYYVRDLINQRLARIPDYTGQVAGVGLHLWRGAYRMDKLRIMKKSGQVTEPFFAAERIDFSLAWGQLFHGRFVSAISVDNLELNIVRGKDTDRSQMTADSRWQDVINDLFPIDITYLDINGGKLRFIDNTRNPRVDVEVHDLKVHATGLRNQPGDTKDNDPLPAKIQLSGITIGNGRLRLFAKAEPLALEPHFELAAELNKVALPALNNFLEAYANVTVTRGRFDVLTQIAMVKGHYEGYVKPFFGDLSFGDPPGRKQGLGERLWEDLVAGLANLLRDKQTHQVATRIPFSGDGGKFDLRTWKSIENALHHGFVAALPKGFEGTTHPDSAASKLPATPTAAPPRS